MWDSINERAVLRRSSHKFFGFCILQQKRNLLNYLTYGTKDILDRLEKVSLINVFGQEVTDLSIYMCRDSSLTRGKG